MLFCHRLGSQREQQQDNREKYAVFGMSSRSNSPSISSDDNSELNFSFTEDPSGDNGKGYLYDDSLEPVVTEEEVTAYEESSAREEEELQEYQCGRTGKTSVSTCYVLLIQLYIYFPLPHVLLIFVLSTHKTCYRVLSQMSCFILLQDT